MRAVLDAAVQLRSVVEDGAAIAAGEQGSSLEMPVAAAAYALDPVNAATNAGGPRAFKYGVTREYVRGCSFI